MANTLKYTNGTGPAFVDGTTGFTSTFNAQSLTADRTLTLPDAAGTVALTASPTFTGDVNASTGNVLASTAGKGFRAKEGSNAKQGTATLVGGTVTVSNTSITTSSRIFLTVQSLGTVSAPKAVAVTARVASTSFTITSSDATDTSVVAYEIFEPA